MKKLLTLIISFAILLGSCAPKANCGSKKQAKKRYKKMKSFAPGMAY